MNTPKPKTLQHTPFTHRLHPRPIVEIRLPDQSVICGPRGAPVGEFLRAVPEPAATNTAPIVGAVVNGELRELTYPIKMEARVRPVTMGEADGMLIYRRSLTFLLDAAFEDLFSDAILTVDHSVSSGGYYCDVKQRPPLNAAELLDLEAHMRALVAADMPFSKREVTLTEAIAYFQAKGYDDKARLLAHRQKDYLPCTPRRPPGLLSRLMGLLPLPALAGLNWSTAASPAFPAATSLPACCPCPNIPSCLRFRLYTAG
jgi:hypothetical protein